MKFARSTHLTAKVAVFILMATVWALAFSSGPPTGHTGGFGDLDCTACHMGHTPVDSGRELGGSFAISGVPESYTPGTPYPITVTIDQPGQSRWGFQLAARLQTSAIQAGTFTLTDPDSTQSETDLAGVTFVSHTSLGTHAGEAGPISWTFTWTAPADASGGMVVFNAAGNASNNMGKSSGGYIYLTAATSSADSGDPGDEE